jgi:putative ABC transport system ATP-binding protein
MISLKNINKNYSEKNINNIVLKDLNLSIKNGDFVAIMGRSGCGKTTLLNIIGCMDRYDSGEYYFNDINMSTLKGKQLSIFRNQNIGFVFQSFNLINDLTALDNVQLPMGIANTPKKIRKEKAIELLKEVGIEEKAFHRPNELSGGQQQRVSVARALANNPQIILADEPTGNLDEYSGCQVMEYLKKLNLEKKITIIMVTHDKVSSDYANYILEMRDGVICYER